jgi:hypothetical protein
VYDFINRRKNLSVPSKRSQLDFADLTSSFVEMNKRISEKLKLRGESIVRDIEMSKSDDKIENENEEELNRQDGNKSKSDESGENFKIEYSLNLKDEDDEKILKKSEKKDHTIKNTKINKSAKSKIEDQDEEEFYNFTQNKKKAKNEMSSQVKENQLPLQASASKFTLLDNESPAKSNAPEKVNKIIKRKWHQVAESSMKQKKVPGQEFVSADKIVLKLNTNTTAEKFKDQSGEDSIQKLNQGYVAEKSENEKIEKESKSESDEDEEMDSESEMDIPDIF